MVYGDTSQDGVWYSGHSSDRLGLEFGEKPFNPFPDLPDEENEDDEWVFPLANVGNAIRLAASLSKREGVELTVFLMGDGVTAAMAGQKTPDGYYKLDRMIGTVVRNSGEILCCGTCIDACRFGAIRYGFR